MKLLRLAKKKWEVLAVCDNRGNCQVLKALIRSGKNSSAAISMLHTLLREIPRDGPTTENVEKAKSLGDGIWELRKHASSGGTPRAYYFMVEGNRIIFSEAHIKRLPKIRNKSA